jgi:hypothetical protein
VVRDLARAPLPTISTAPYMPAAAFYLCKQSYICLADRYYVILNLADDKYFCIGREAFDALKPWLRLSVSETMSPAVDSIRSLEPPPDVIEDLIRNRIITSSTTEAVQGARPSLLTPTGSLHLPAATLPLTFARYGAAFFSAAASANRWLRTLPLQETVQRVTSAAERGGARGIFDYQKARTRIAAFNRLRPFYDRGYLCLFDSLALLLFLAKYQLFPRWIFGVQSEPFSAHCWVQEEDVVLNDTVERVQPYTPILSV